jgi:hypothetical protein
MMDAPQTHRFFSAACSDPHDASRALRRTIPSRRRRRSALLASSAIAACCSTISSLEEFLQRSVGLGEVRVGSASARRVEGRNGQGEVVFASSRAGRRDGMRVALVRWTGAR